MPATLDDLRKTIPELAGLDDNDAADLIHAVYYPGVDRDQIARELGVKPKAPAAPTDGQFVSGFKRSFGELPGLAAGVGAYGADVVGANSARDKMLAYAKAQNDALAQSHAADASSLSDVLEGKANTGDFLANAAGYTTGQALQSLATGGLGALGMRMLAKKGAVEAGELAAKAALEKGADEAVARKAAADAILTHAGHVGGAVGAGGHNLGMELGSIYPDAVDQANKEGRQLDAGDLARVGGSALAAAGVDTAMEAVNFNKIMGGSGAEGGLLRRAAREVPSGMAREAGTEAVQTGIEHYGAGQPIADDAGLRDIIDSAAVGAVGGGLAGGVASTHAREHAAEVPPAAPVIAPPVVPDAVQPATPAAPATPPPNLGAPLDASGFTWTPPTAPAPGLSLVPQDSGAPAGSVPFQADNSFQGAPVVRSGEQPPAAPDLAPQTFPTAIAANIAIGQTGLLGSHTAIETAPGTWEIRPTGALGISMLKPGVYDTGAPATPPTPGDALRAQQVPDNGPLSRATNIGLAAAADQVDAAAATAPAPPAPLEPTHEAALLDFANQRARDLETKAVGIPEKKTPGPDGKPVVTPEVPKQFLTPTEQAEQQFLAEHGGNAQALATHYTPAPAAAAATPPAGPAEAALGLPAPAPTPPPAAAAMPPVAPAPAAPARPTVPGPDGTRRAVFSSEQAANAYLDDARKGRATPLLMSIQPIQQGDGTWMLGTPAEAQAAKAFVDKLGPTGKPFAHMGQAKAVAKKIGGEAVPVDGGFAVRQETPKAVNEWENFPPESGTLGMPRAAMPQIKAEHRGAMTQFLAARGIAHTTEEVDPATLKPTQAEFSPVKVLKASEFEGGDRSILVSSDGYVLDGHHQWLAKLATGEPVKAIKLDAPIEQLVAAAHDFPSSTVAEGAPVEARPAPAPAPQSARARIAEKVAERKAAAEPVKPAEPAPKPKRMPAAEKAAQARAAKLADYFAPGNIVKSYGGHDRVVAFDPVTERGGFNVRAHAVEKVDGKWVDKPREDDRNHSTMPDEKALAAGPVERAAKEQPNAQPDKPAAAPAEATRAEGQPTPASEGGAGGARAEQPARAGTAGVEAPGLKADESLPFSRGKDTDEARALKALSENDSLFALPKSTKATVEGIAADNDPNIKVKKITSIPGETRYDLTMPNGTTARMMVREASPYGKSTYGFDYYAGEMRDVKNERPGENPEDVDPKKGDVWIDVSLLKAGGEGRSVYNIAATYAHNTGRVFIGDPAGLSDDAMIRRPEQMLSSALKFGTTEHLAPHPRQVNGDKALGVPGLKWVYGDDLGNIRRLIDLNLKVQDNGLDVRFDPSTGTFLDSNGQPLDRAAIQALAVAAHPAGGSRAGGATVARAAVWRALLREEGGSGEGAVGGRDGLLARLAKRAADGAPELHRILYSLGQAGEEGRVAGKARVAETQAFADKVTSKWANAPKVVVVHDMTDPRVPAAVRNEDERQRSQGAAGEPEGFYQGGTVYLVASQLPGDAAALRVLMHEALGHYGLRSVFGSELATILDRMSILQRTKVLSKAREYGLDFDKLTDRRAAAEEVLAEMAQTTPELGWVKRAVAAIRSWLRDNVPGFGAMKMTDDEVIRSFILPARGWVKAGENASSSATGLSVAFQRVWHGSPYKFDRFDSANMGSGEGNQAYGWGHYFASRREIADHYRRVLSGGSPNDFEKDGRVLSSPADLAEEYFKPGRIVRGYSGADKVLGFHREGDRWRVDVVGVKANGDPMSSERPRWHSTFPDAPTLRSALEEDGWKPKERGQLYAADIPDDEHMLLWDKSVGDQPSAVRVALQKLFASNAIDDATKNLMGQTGAALDSMSGRKVYQALTNSDAFEGGTDARAEQASKALRDAGIRGIKYLDNTSRAAGNGTHNYVVFDDNDVSIAGTSFSRSAAIDTLRSAPAVRTVANVVSDVVSRPDGRNIFARAWQNTVGTPYHMAQRVPEFKAVYDAAQDYIHDISTFATDAANLAPTVLPQLNSTKDFMKAQSLPEVDRKALSRAVFEGTLMHTRDAEGNAVPAPDEMAAGSAGVRWTDAELRQRFGFNDRQVGLYNETRAAIDRSLDSVVASEVARAIGPALSSDMKTLVSDGDLGRFKGAVLSFLAKTDTVQQATVQEMYDKIDALKARGYAPLMRFGKHAVYITRETPAGSEQLYFGMYESAREANAAARDFEQQYAKDKAVKVERSDMAESAFKLYKGMTPETLELFARLTGSDKDEALQTYLKNAKASRSALKRLIHRKGVEGYSEQVDRVLAQFITSNARMSSANVHGQDMTRAAQDIPDKMGDVKDYAAKLVEYVQNPGPEATAAKALLFTQYIGGSVASALVNMTQPFMMTLPYLAQFGGATATKNLLAGMAQATAIARGGKVANAELAAALAKAEKEGIVSPQEIHQLMGQAAGRGSMLGSIAQAAHLPAGVVDKANATGKRLAFAWGSLFGLAEQFNRHASFIAAWNIAKEQGIADPFAFAAKTVAETQGVYNRGNRPAWARGPIGGTLMTFKQFSISWLEFLNRLPRKQQVMALGALALTSGAEGLPFAEDLEDIIDTLGQKLGYATNSKRWLTQLLRDMVGADVAEFVQHGMTAVPGMPLDISNRLSVGNLIPGTALLKKSTTDTSRELTEWLGAGGSAVQGGINAFRQGSLMPMAPVAIQNVAKAADMWQNGMYRDGSGKKVDDATGADAVIKGIGFQPAHIAKIQRDTGMEKQSEDLAQNTRKEITDRWAQALFDKNTGAVDDARAQLRQWNADNPEWRITINQAAVLSRVKEMRLSKEDRMLKGAPKAMRATLRGDLAN